jgi:hypothetical protein
VNRLLSHLQIDLDIDVSDVAELRSLIWFDRIQYARWVNLCS